VASLVVSTFPEAFLEVLHHSLQHVESNCCHFFPDVLFQILGCPWFLFVHLALEISSEEEVLRLGTLVPMNIDVPTKYPLSHDDRIVVFEIRLHSKSPVLYRPALHGNWNALSLARRALKDKFPHANGSTHTCFAKSSGISAGPCIILRALGASRRHLTAHMHISAVLRALRGCSLLSTELSKL